MKTLTVKFQFKAETAGAVRYEEVDAKGKVLSIKDDTAVIGALYLRKKQIGIKAPKTLTVTIEGSGVVTTEPKKERESKEEKAPAKRATAKAVKKTGTATTAVKKSSLKKKKA